jgi:hypothetical protein
MCFFLSSRLHFCPWVELSFALFFGPSILRFRTPCTFELLDFHARKFALVTSISICSQDGTARMGRPGWDGQDGTARMGRPGRDGQDGTAKTGYDN